MKSDNQKRKRLGSYYLYSLPTGWHFSHPVQGIRSSVVNISCGPCHLAVALPSFQQQPSLFVWVGPMVVKVSRHRQSQKALLNFCETLNSTRLGKETLYYIYLNNLYTYTSFPSRTLTNKAVEIPFTILPKLKSHMSLTSKVNANCSSDNPSHQGIYFQKVVWCSGSALGS